MLRKVAQGNEAVVQSSDRKASNRAACTLLPRALVQYQVWLMFGIIL